VRRSGTGTNSVTWLLTTKLSRSSRRRVLAGGGRPSLPTFGTAGEVGVVGWPHKSLSIVLHTLLHTCRRDGSRRIARGLGCAPREGICLP
jgi:hypothetical protein